MFGNLANNSQIITLIKQHLIDITPFYEEKLRYVHYPLTPLIILKKYKDGSIKQAQNFKEKVEDYVVEPNGYVIIEIFERIIISSEGIIGKFVPSSNLIEAGFGLTAGRIEFPYGKEGEVVRFGLKNLLDVENKINIDLRLAYVEFFDLRGLKNIPSELTQREYHLFKTRLRRANDDGPYYEG